MDWVPEHVGNADANAKKKVRENLKHENVYHGAIQKRRRDARPSAVVRKVPQCLSGMGRPQAPPGDSRSPRPRNWRANQCDHWKRARAQCTTSVRYGYPADKPASFRRECSPPSQTFQTCSLNPHSLTAVTIHLRRCTRAPPMLESEASGETGSCRKE